MNFLHDAVIFLFAAVVGVALFKRSGLGTVLGYLAGGIVVGPSGLKLVGHVEQVMGFAEIGVVLLLFVIGLELQPMRLWTMRGHVFGLGSLQVVVTTALLWVVGWLGGLTPAGALVAGFALSLSSTALAVGLLSERKQLTAGHGRIAFGMLLFQDVAAIPFLALVPMLAGQVREGGASPLRGILTFLAALVVLVLLSRFVLRPVLKMVAALHAQEAFTALALLVVAGTAVAMEAIGLSATLGAFLAGVLLADSEYRHELEADIEPFKGLLLGLFFMAVGMSLDLSLLAKNPGVVLGLVALLTVVKGAVLAAIGYWKLRDTAGALRLAVSTSQGGEFAFVVFGFATASAVLSREQSDILVLVVGLSLAVSPIAFALLEKFVTPKLVKPVTREFDEVTYDGEPPVLIAGFGRVGQVVGRVLLARKIPFVALDASSEHVDFVRRFGNKVFYGDASRLEMLHAAGAEKAKIFVLAIDDVDASVRTAELVQKHFPHLQIVARARNRQHAYALLGIGVKRLFRETFSSSVELTGEVLTLLGFNSQKRDLTLQKFREHDEKLLIDSFENRGDVKKLQESAQQARAMLEQLMDADVRDR